MMKVSWIVPVLWFASTVLLAWSVPGNDGLPPELMNSTRGQSTGWCHNDNACSAFALTCSGPCTTVGEKCGEDRELEYPESCNTSYGNNYCNAEGNEVQVVCAREWDCKCEAGVSSEDEPTPHACVRQGEGGAGAGAPNGNGSTPKKGTIITDSFNCAT